MTQPVLEGTWEEILEHSAELEGQRVRLVVLTNGPSSASVGNLPQKQASLADKLKARVGRVSFEPADLSERVEEQFGDYLAEQHSTTQHSTTQAP
ncbi:MAG: hypothetical protein AAGD25_41090 [Cyanobacteria bacterium P01_F01_bin.150]